MPDENTRTGNKSRSILYSVLAIILVLSVFSTIYFLPKPYEAEKVTPLDSGATKKGEITEEMSLIDVSNPANIIQTVPSGFPLDIPIESKNIVESYKINYPENKVTQNTVSYTSSKSGDSLWTIYSEFLIKDGYALEPATNKQTGQIYGTKYDDMLNIVISKRNNQSYVQITFLERK